MDWIKSKQYKDNDNVELTKTKMETQELLNDNKYLKHLTTIEYFKYIEKFNLDDTFEQFIIFLNTVEKALLLQKLDFHIFLLLIHILNQILFLLIVVLY